MNRIKRSVIIILALIFLTANMNAQEQEIIKEVVVVESEAYDPLIPQMFAFDKDNNIFAGLNNADNTVDLIRYDGKSLQVFNRVLVDVVAKRHDTEHIYRPKGVAIYQDFVVFLASHRDSCYLAVLDMEGNIVRKLTFEGAANAFSYSGESKELYIAGETANGYDVIVLDAAKGVDKIDLSDAAALHYRKPKMSEKIAVADPRGWGMTAVAVSVVFLGLLMLALCFKGVGRFFTSKFSKKEKEHAGQAAAEQKKSAPIAADQGGEVYAAIAAAIHLYNEELHDMENTTLTINKVSRTYSPWSSKIHGMNTYFNNIGYKK